MANLIIKKSLPVFIISLFITVGGMLSVYADDHPASGATAVQEKFRQPAEIAAESIKLLESTPDDIALRLKYADALFEMNKIDLAMKEYQKVNQADKKNSDALLGIACCHERKGYAGFALSSYRSACIADPSNAAAVNGYLNCAMKNNKLPDVMPYIKRLAQADKHNAAGCYYLIASKLVDKEYWKAQTYAKEANKLDPDCFPGTSIRAAGLVYKTGDAVIFSTPSSNRQQRLSGGTGMSSKSSMGKGGGGSGMPGGGSTMAPSSRSGGSTGGMPPMPSGGGSSSTMAPGSPGIGPMPKAPGGGGIGSTMPPK